MRDIKICSCDHWSFYDIFEENEDALRDNPFAVQCFENILNEFVLQCKNEEIDEYCFIREGIFYVVCYDCYREIIIDVSNEYSDEDFFLRYDCLRGQQCIGDGTRYQCFYFCKSCFDDILVSAIVSEFDTLHDFLDEIYIQFQDWKLMEHLIEI